MKNINNLKINDVMYATVTFNADPFQVDYDEAAEDVLKSIAVNGLHIIEPWTEDYETACAKLDIDPDNGERVYGNCEMLLYKDDLDIDCERKSVISDLEYDSKTHVLSYDANGEQIDVQGEFDISDGVLSHTHVWSNGSEEDIEVVVDSDISLDWYKANVDVWGNVQYGSIVLRESISIGITADDVQLCDTAEEAANDMLEQITYTYGYIDDYDRKSIKNDIINHIDHLFA